MARSTKQRLLLLLLLALLTTLAMLVLVQVESCWPWLQRECAASRPQPDQRIVGKDSAVALPLLPADQPTIHRARPPLPSFTQPSIQPATTRAPPPPPPQANLKAEAAQREAGLGPAVASSVSDVEPWPAADRLPAANATNNNHHAVATPHAVKVKPPLLVMSSELLVHSKFRNLPYHLSVANPTMAYHGDQLYFYSRLVLSNAVWLKCPYGSLFNYIRCPSTNIRRINYIVHCPLNPTVFKCM
jgi:hypothetical protein